MQNKRASTNRLNIVTAIGLLLLLMLLSASCTGSGPVTADNRSNQVAPSQSRQDDSAAARSSESQQAAQKQAARRAAAPDSGLPTIAYKRLPAQARETISLIQSGGPFHYRQDGVVFQNRERHLPSQPSGYYHEYTVPTPGSRDRGARRIVTGANGELYYTDDHYASFKQVEMP
jgi:ribonuclease T1